MAKKRLCVEELEVNKYLEDQDAAKASSEYDMLYREAQVDQDIEAEAAEATPETEAVDSTDETAGEQPASSEEPSDAIIDESTDDVVIDSEDDVATEAFSFQRGIEIIKDSIVTLGKVGIHYTPIALSGLYKGTIYGITQLIRGLLSSHEAVVSYYTRHVHTFQSLQEDIHKLQKVLDTIEAPKENEIGQYSKVKVINALKIQDSTDIAANINGLTQSLGTTIDAISKSVNRDIGYIKNLVALVTSRNIKDQYTPIEEIPIKHYLTEKPLPGFDQSEYVSSYQMDTTLPGDIRVVGILPTVTGDNIDRYTKAYNQSSLMLWLDPNSFTEIDSIPYASVDQIKATLDALNGLCNEAIKQVEFYEHIQRDQKNLKYLFRIYISSVVSSKSKMKSSVSLIDFINLKSMSIQRLYIPFAIDMHEYTIKIVQSGLRYCEDQINRV